MRVKKLILALGTIAGIAMAAPTTAEPQQPSTASGNSASQAHATQTQIAVQDSVSAPTALQGVVSQDTVQTQTQINVPDSASSQATLQGTVSQDTAQTQTAAQADSASALKQAEMLEPTPSRTAAPDPALQKTATPEPSLKSAVGSPGKEPVIENPWEFVLVTAAFLSVVLVIMFTGDK